jgi:tRNA 2-(methylsulfanyl)-N6-isopentenyladenosine37 hydroxylase
MSPPESILAAPTPEAWTEAAAARLPELLVDHANCEKKAASSAMALIFAYPEDTSLVLALSRLAREELRHFEQVQRAMRELGIRVARQRPGRYAHELRRALRTTHPQRKLDLLLAAALIEARSAERFALLADRLPAPLTALYRELAGSEARHGAALSLRAAGGHKLNSLLQASRARNLVSGVSTPQYPRSRERLGFRHERPSAPSDRRR